MTLNQITLIGVGLIGGSFVLDLKRHRLAHTIIGIDTSPTNLDRALERRVIDRASSQITPVAIQSSDLVLIATPVASLPAICQALAPLLSPHTIISDVGSTKQATLAAFAQHLPQHYPHCVASHPIAGSDRSGALAAQFGLYQGKKLILCPHEQQDTGSLNTIAQLWQNIGAEVHTMPAAEHDQIFAAVSHFPHLLAFAYVHQMLDHPQGAHYLNFAGSGFRDFTRIAASSPEMWRDIALANRDSLLQLIREQKQQLEQLERSLKTHNAQELHDYFQAAQQLREQWGETH